MLFERAIQLYKLFWGIFSMLCALGPFVILHINIGNHGNQNGILIGCHGNKNVEFRCHTHYVSVYEIWSKLNKY